MKRLVLAVVLLAGCGGGDPEPEPAQASKPVTYKAVSDDMRDIAALAADGCANEAAIRRAMGRLTHHAALLPVDAPPKVLRLVDEVLADSEDTLRSC